MGLNRKMCSFQLIQDRRRVGEEFTANLDWLDEPEVLRKLLFDAIDRLGAEPWTVGEYLLEVTDIASGKHVTNFAAVYEE